MKPVYLGPFDRIVGISFGGPRGFACFPADASGPRPKTVFSRGESGWKARHRDVLFGPYWWMGLYRDGSPPPWDAISCGATSIFRRGKRLFHQLDMAVYGAAVTADDSGEDWLLFVGVSSSIGGPYIFAAPLADWQAGPIERIGIIPIILGHFTGAAFSSTGDRLMAPAQIGNVYTYMDMAIDIAGKTSWLVGQASFPVTLPPWAAWASITDSAYGNTWWGEFDLLASFIPGVQSYPLDQRRTIHYFPAPDYSFASAARDWDGNEFVSVDRAGGHINHLTDGDPVAIYNAYAADQNAAHSDDPQWTPLVPLDPATAYFTSIGVI